MAERLTCSQSKNSLREETDRCLTPQESFGGRDTEEAGGQGEGRGNNRESEATKKIKEKRKRWIWGPYSRRLHATRETIQVKIAKIIRHTQRERGTKMSAIKNQGR